MPGVPPDAANIVKRVLKGIFKRGKKSRQDAPDNDSTTTTTTTTPTYAPPPAQQDQGFVAPAAPPIENKAPQLPPIENASPLQGATESSRPVPPTHPLSTGEHDRPEEAVPVNRDAEPAPGPPMGVGTGSVAPSAPASNTLKEPEKLGAARDVSPPISTVDAADAPKSGAVSAISNEQPKTDGASDGVSADGARAMEPTAATDPSPQPPTTAAAAPATTTEPLDSAPPPANENVAPQTNGTSPTNPTSTSPTDTAAPAPAVDSTPNPATSDEKMPATMEEAPPIKTVRTAPGMSATSGPLEDFPEGGDAKA